MSSPEYFTIVISGQKPNKIHFVRGDQVIHQAQIDGVITWESVKSIAASANLKSEDVSRVFLLMDGIPVLLIPAGEQIPSHEIIGRNTRQMFIDTANMQLVHADCAQFVILQKEFPWLHPVHAGQVLMSFSKDADNVMLYAGRDHVVIVYQRFGKPVFVNGFETSDSTEGLYFLTAILQQYELGIETQITVLGEQLIVESTVRLFKEFYPNVNVGLSAAEAYNLMITTSAKCG